MPKSNKRKIIILSLVFGCLVLLFPFINGLGCSNSAITSNSRLGVAYSQCEFGRITISAKHGVTHENYTEHGYWGFFRNQYFIVITDREITNGNSSSKSENLNLRSYYYRSFYSGYIYGDKEKVLLISSPESSISPFEFEGDLGFISYKP